MGERANIVIQEETYLDGNQKGGRVWLYGHWIGDRTTGVVADVIERGERLNDESYLARVIFEAMIPTEQRGESTSYGISTRITDNNYPILVLYPAMGTVHIEDDNGVVTHKPIPYADYLTAYNSIPRRTKPGVDFGDLFEAWEDARQRHLLTV